MNDRSTKRGGEKTKLNNRGHESAISVTRMCTASLSEADMAAVDFVLTFYTMLRALWKAIKLLRNVATQAGCVAFANGGASAASKMSSNM